MRFALNNMKRVVQSKSPKVKEHEALIETMIDCSNPFTFERLCQEVRRAELTYRFGPKVLPSDTRLSMPMPGTIAVDLIELIEHGIVKVVR